MGEENQRMPFPGHAYVPGRTARHDPANFVSLRASVRPGADAAQLQASEAWRVGWVWLVKGYCWEAHEVIEPIWMALPEGSNERLFVQAVIQVANAGVKAAMGRPRAVVRLAGMSRALLAGCGDAAEEVMGLRVSAVEQVLARIEAQVA